MFLNIFRVKIKTIIFHLLDGEEQVSRWRENYDDRVALNSPGHFEAVIDFKSRSPQETRTLEADSSLLIETRWLLERFLSDSQSPNNSTASPYAQEFGISRPPFYPTDRFQSFVYRTHRGPVRGSEQYTTTPWNNAGQ